MFKTRITDLLGIDTPIVGGSMMLLSKKELTAAISAAGALGILASANYKDLEEFRAAVKWIQDRTDKPFAVNLNLFPAFQPMDNNLFLDVMEQEGVKIVETSGPRAPDDLVGRIHAAGMLLIHKCVAPRYARKAESIGADAVTVVGWENGGAVGKLDIATMVLVPRVVDAVKVPVIAGGGVGDGRGVAAVLALGADAAIVGTRFMAAEEAPVHPNVRKRMIELQEHETTLILRSLENTHRVARTANALKVQEMEARGADLAELFAIIGGPNSARLMAEGDLDAGLLWIGQAVGFIREIKPAAEIVAEIAADAQAALARMERLFGRDGAAR